MNIISNGKILALFNEHHIKWKDIMDMDEVAVLNAIPTKMRIYLQTSIIF
ncbi:MAG: hypothetical protein K0S30_195 [Clostridia bacterium]|nr:hypothetical protein [Clostridia bacterium]